ncbi:MAG: sigma-70 family RNA polymerase sigma factor [Candidatus Thiodiazotropha sp.]
MLSTLEDRFQSLGGAMANGEIDQQDAIKQRNQELEALLAACALNDRKAFARLYRMTSAKLYGVVLRILVRDEWAQDCLQDAYIKIWSNADSYRTYLAAPLTWMSTIARNQALDLLRKRKREVMEADGDKGLPEQVDDAPLPLDGLSKSDEGRRLETCLEALKAQQRQMVVLAYFKGLTHDELASHTDTPLGTVKSWIRRGLNQLRRCLENDA